MVIALCVGLGLILICCCLYICYSKWQERTHGSLYRMRTFQRSNSKSKLNSVSVTEGSSVDSGS